MKTAVILNPVSGGGKALKLLPKLGKWAKENKVDFELFTSTAPGESVELARLCMFKRFERVVAIGGDGSINEIGSVLAGSETILGVLPGGTGNDFYKMLGNNGTLRSGLETAFMGEAVDIDVAVINGMPFFNAVGIGLDAQVAQRAQAGGSGGMLVYLIAVFKSIRRYKPFDLTIELDKVRFETKSTLVCIGNGRSTGGGFYLTPQAAFDDGLLDVCIVEDLTRSQIFRYLPRTLNGSHTRLPGVKLYRSKKIVISSFQELPVHIDGETAVDPLKRVEIVLDEKKLKVAARK